MIKKTAIAGLVAAALGSGLAQAQAPAPAEPASPHTLTGNVGLYSQYIFRGLTQTDRHPALQGGFDYSHSSGLYAGTWASNISWLRENLSAPGLPFGTYGEGGSLEWDFYGGYKWSLPSDITLDVGTLYYWYPGKINPAVTAGFAPLPVPKADTWEVYAGVGWKWLSGKLSYAVRDQVFGTENAGGSWYLDLSANVPLGDFSKDMNGLTLIAHWGMQKYRGTDGRNAGFVVAGGPYATTPDNDELYSYSDAKLGLSYALPKDFTFGAYYTKVFSYNKLGYGGTGDTAPGGLFGPYPRNIAKGTGTVFISKTF